MLDPYSKLFLLACFYFGIIYYCTSEFPGLDTCLRVFVCVSASFYDIQHVLVLGQTGGNRKKISEGLKYKLFRIYIKKKKKLKI